MTRKLYMVGILSAEKMNEIFKLSQDRSVNLSSELVESLLEGIIKKPNTYDKLKRVLKSMPSMDKIYEEMLSIGE